MPQKIYVYHARKRTKGRDIFDLMFLMSKGVQPNKAYLTKNMNLMTGSDIQELFIQKTRSIDFQPFIFDHTDDSVLYFEKIVKEYAWE